MTNNTEPPMPPVDRETATKRNGFIEPTPLLEYLRYNTPIPSMDRGAEGGRWCRHRNLGACIGAAREKKKLTVAQLAKRIGVHRSTVAKWENGTTRHVGHANIAFALCDELELDFRAVAFARCGCNQIYVPEARLMAAFLDATLERWQPPRRQRSQ